MLLLLTAASSARPRRPPGFVGSGVARIDGKSSLPFLRLHVVTPRPRLALGLILRRNRLSTVRMTCYPCGSLSEQVCGRLRPWEQVFRRLDLLPTPDSPISHHTARRALVRPLPVDPDKAVVQTTLCAVQTQRTRSFRCNARRFPVSGRRLGKAHQYHLVVVQPSWHTGGTRFRAWHSTICRPAFWRQSRHNAWHRPGPARCCSQTR